LISESAQKPHFLLPLFILNTSVDGPVMRSLGVTTEVEMLKDLCSMGPLMAIGLEVGLAGHGDHVPKKEENGIASPHF